MLNKFIDNKKIIKNKKNNNYKKNKKNIKRFMYFVFINYK